MSTKTPKKKVTVLKPPTKPAPRTSLTDAGKATAPEPVRIWIANLSADPVASLKKAQAQFFARLAELGMHQSEANSFLSSFMIIDRRAFAAEQREFYPKVAYSDHSQRMLELEECAETCKKRHDELDQALVDMQKDLADLRLKVCRHCFGGCCSAKQ